MYHKNIKFKSQIIILRDHIFFYSVQDLPETVEKVTTFFGKTYSDKQIAKLVEHLKIENFRKNYIMAKQAFSPSVSTGMKPKEFIRQGKKDNWKEMFTTEIEEKFSKWKADNTKNTDLTFPD